MNGKGNEAYEKLMRELGEKYGDLYQRIDTDTPGVRHVPAAPSREFKPWIDEEATR